VIVVNGISMPSFDVVSKLDLAELDNAINQAKKEIATRYDFQGTKTEISQGDAPTVVQLKSSTEPRLQAAKDVLYTKLVKRGIPLNGATASAVDSAALGQVKLTVTLQQGIPVEKAKELVKALKDSKIKAQASIQGDQVRVTGKNRDDLQAVIALFKQQQEKVKVDLQFINFRD
jgi:cyclic-di-GMP-binding protein